METKAQKIWHFNLSDKTKELIFDLITYAYIILFVYTACSKIITHTSFEKVLSVSPLLGEFSILISYFIPIAEILLSIMLIINKTKKLGLALSLILIFLFTIYLLYMVSIDVTLPCECGGVISLLTWGQHIVFNSIFIVLGLIGINIKYK